jgi:hypothetical protein
MVIASNHSLIPYPGHHYPVQPYLQDNPVSNQERRQGPLAGPKPFRQPHSEIKGHAGRSDRHGHLYDFTLFLQYSAFDQVGLLVDIYA